MPAAEKGDLTLADHENDTGEFAARKATAGVKADRIEPNLGPIGIALDMDMRRLRAIASEEKEAVGSDTENSGHGEQFEIVRG